MSVENQLCANFVKIIKLLAETDMDKNKRNCWLVRKKNQNEQTLLNQTIEDLLVT